MAAATAWMRRFSRDHSTTSSGDAEATDGTAEVGKKLATVGLAGGSPHPPRPHGPPPSASRSRAFLSGLVNSSKRRLSLPVNERGTNPEDSSNRLGAILSARHASEDKGRPRNGSIPDFLEPGQDKAHLTSKGRRKTPRKIFSHAEKLERRRNKPLSRSLRESAALKTSDSRRPSKGSKPTGAAFLVPGASSVRLADSLALCFQRALHSGVPHSKFSTPPVFHQPAAGLDAILVEQHQLRGGLTRNRSGSTRSADGALSGGRRGSSGGKISNFLDLVRRKGGGGMKQQTADLPSNGAAGKNDFEFRPNAQPAASAFSRNAAASSSGSQNRSKSPGAFINRLSSFARGRKYRNSLSERTNYAVNADDRTRRDVNRELQRCKEEQGTRLDLNSSEITAVPPAIKDLTQVTELFLNLETLWLRYNKLTHISPDIGRLKKLKMVDLRENKITELPKEIGDLSALSILLVSGNHLKSLPEEIGHLSNLVLLDEFIVESNRLNSLPDGILVSLNNLKTINLSRNLLTAFPQGGPKQFEAAVTVNLEHNAISLIPFGIFAGSAGLTRLNLKENQLTSLPLDFGTWVSLTELNLSNNELTELPSDVDKLVNLEVLVLSTNRLRKLPSQIGSLRKLRELDLEENELECIPSDIGFLMSLNKLWVQSNRLTSLPRTIGNLLSLTDLRVGENLLPFIPEEIGHLENLKSLYLNDNPNLHALPFELALCSSLEIMSIERCPLSQIPHDITEGGPSLVIQQ
ncbi:hypothetical protein M3Y99_01740100 [Aphelenchoides fujianensis]|nr:hypothetical protein M3Y99_01740100 [Aphelenchoides fujianensis]